MALARQYNDAPRRLGLVVKKAKPCINIIYKVT